MDFLRLVLVFLHLLGMAGLVAMYFLQTKAGKGAPLVKGWVHVGLLQLVTGIGLVGIAEAADGDGPNHVKVGVKLVVLIGILVLILMGNKKKALVQSWLPNAILALVVLNTGIAVFWT